MFLEATKLAYATKTKGSITSKKLGSLDFSLIAKSVFIEGKSAIPPLFNYPEVLSLASDRAKLFAKNKFGMVMEMEWKFWNGPFYKNKSGPFPLLNVARET